MPRFSTIAKKNERSFKDTDLFEQIFYRVLMIASESKQRHAFFGKNYGRADNLRQNEDVKSIYAKRKETIEPVFERRKRSIVCVGLL
ncbi:hypothetical protein EI200_18170 [Peribacillus simplex]|nr:hypothetical protein EI200_18170 [Peribacillus simplex]